MGLSTKCFGRSSPLNKWKWNDNITKGFIYVVKQEKKNFFFLVSSWSANWKQDFGSGSTEGTGSSSGGGLLSCPHHQEGKVGGRGSLPTVPLLASVSPCRSVRHVSSTAFRCSRRSALLTDRRSRVVTECSPSLFWPCSARASYPLLSNLGVSHQRCEINGRSGQPGGRHLRNMIISKDLFLLGDQDYLRLPKDEKRAMQRPTTTKNLRYDWPNNL